MESAQSVPVALTIASSDSGGGAGIQADLKTFAACGVYGTSAIAALTAQNPKEVAGISPVTPDFLEMQIQQVLDYFPVKAIKIGMLFSEELITAVAKRLESVQVPIVLDPVMIASSGKALITKAAQHTLVDALFPLATLITPNLDEAQVLLKQAEQPQGIPELAAWADELLKCFQTATLLKGGHLKTETLTDILVEPEKASQNYTAQRIENLNTHGSGCTLSSALAAYLAQGATLAQAVSQAHAYLQQSMQQAAIIRGEAFINHSAHG